jgi:hypothetical protein
MYERFVLVVFGCGGPAIAFAGLREHLRGWLEWLWDV